MNGVEVRYRDLVGCEARLVGFNDKAIVTIYSNQPRQRAQKIGADAWFDIDEADQYDIMEDAIKISNDQVLTLLWLGNHKMLTDRDKNQYW